jgi:hypothetical protein
MPTTAAAALPLQDQSEYRLLCQALITAPAAAQDAGWRTLDAPGWQRLAALAENQGVAPLLYRRLPPDAPEAVKSGLQRSYYSSAANNALLLQELKNILKAFQQAGVPVVVLKGIDLAVELYPDPALRVMSDIDVLVPYPYVRMAVRSLSRLGYQKMNENLAHHHVLLHGGPQKKVAVELHWSLVEAFHPATAGDHPSQDWFWQHTRPWPSADASPAAAGLEGLGALALQAEARLLYLTAHLLLQHAGSGERLLWYYDLHLLLERQPASREMDWTALLRQAVELGWDEALERALQALELRFAAPLPAGYTAARAALPVSEGRRSRPTPQDPGLRRSRTRAVWQGLRAQPLPQRLRLIWDMFFPEPAYLRWRYRPSPAWLWPLYYIYRWFDILRDSILTLVKPETQR